MPGSELKISDKTSIPLREFEFSFARSSGPGGQNVNKVNTKATLNWDFRKTHSISDSMKDRFRRKYGRRINKEGELVITSQRYRDQGRNVADCLAKLQDLLRTIETAPRKRKPTKPSRGSVKRRLNEKKIQSQKKQGRRKVRPDE